MLLMGALNQSLFLNYGQQWQQRATGNLTGFKHYKNVEVRHKVKHIHKKGGILILRYKFVPLGSLVMPKLGI